MAAERLLVATAASCSLELARGGEDGVAAPRAGGLETAEGFSQATVGAGDDLRPKKRFIPSNICAQTFYFKDISIYLNVVV